jgi:hypothetical protein
LKYPKLCFLHYEDERNDTKFHEDLNGRSEKATRVKPIPFTDNRHQLHPLFVHFVSIEGGTNLSETT